MRIQRWVLAIAGVVGASFACGDGPSGSGDPELPILGDCGLVPNYTSQVTLNRWRTFPLRYHVDLSTFPVENRDWIVARIDEGLRRWSAATGDRIGGLTPAGTSAGADFVVAIEDRDMVVAARTTHTTGSPHLAGGRIAFDLETVIRLAELQSEVLAALAAHEMGHLLGIIGHPVTRGVLMRAPLESDEPTVTDVHTLEHAYCR